MRMEAHQGQDQSKTGLGLRQPSPQGHDPRIWYPMFIERHADRVAFNQASSLLAGSRGPGIP